jgi:hypothetical protein
MALQLLTQSLKRSASLGGIGLAGDDPGVLLAAQGSGTGPWVQQREGLSPSAHLTTALVLSFHVHFHRLLKWAIALPLGLVLAVLLAGTGPARTHAAGGMAGASGTFGGSRIRAARWGPSLPCVCLTVFAADLFALDRSSYECWVTHVACGELPRWWPRGVPALLSRSVPTFLHASTARRWVPHHQLAVREERWGTPVEVPRPYCAAQLATGTDALQAGDPFGWTTVTASEDNAARYDYRYRATCLKNLALDRPKRFAC